MKKRRKTLKMDSSNNLPYKSALVTGATGFVGKYLVNNLLQKGVEVTVITRDFSKISPEIRERVQCKGSDLNAELPEFNQDVVFHLAALTDLPECSRDPQKAYRENVQATLNLLTKCMSVKKFVYVSTLGVYGEPQRFPVSEDDPARPVEPYAASKLSAEAFVQGFCTSRRIPFIIARLFNVYGPGQNNRFVIPKIVEAAVKKENIELRNTDSTRDFIFIDDAINGFIALAESPLQGVYNLGSGKETSIDEVIKKLEKLINKPISFRIVQDSNSPQVRRSVADIQKISKDVGWNPHVSLEQGLRVMITHYSQ